MNRYPAVSHLINKQKDHQRVLSILHPKHRTAFAACCCERLIPIYHAFSVVEKWGDPDLLDEAIDEVWNLLEGSKVSENRIPQLLTSLDQLFPDLETHRSLYASLAPDAVEAVRYTLMSATSDDNTQYVSNVLDIIMVVLGRYLEGVNYPYHGFMPSDEVDDYVNWIAASPLKLAEIERQAQELQFLKRQPTLTTAFLRDLRQGAGSIGIDPIRRGLVI